jgi:hypothetical protein
MPTQAGRFGKDILVEIAWLLGSWAISFGLVGVLVGFDAFRNSLITVQLPTQDIATLPPNYLVLPGLLLFATVAAGVRTVASRFKRPTTLAVLAGLAVGWGLLLKFIWGCSRG